MSNAKHTPGPWNQAPYSPTDVVANGDTMVAMAREGLNGIERDKAIANARLIAAAPDLLDALERIAELSYDSEATRVAREAIAKARGE
jgi:hypothetical protein